MSAALSVSALLFGHRHSFTPVDLRSKKSGINVLICFGFVDCHVAFADSKHHWAIHRDAPPFVEQSTEQEILITGIKVRLSEIGAG